MKTRLKELMQEKGMMSKTLAEKIGISEVSVSALVNGKSNNLDTLAKAAQCLGVEMWELFASFEDVVNSPANTLISKTDNVDPTPPPLGDDFPRGRQIDFVLGKWKLSEEPIVDQKADEAVEIIKSFVTQGPDRTMNQFNKR